MPTEHKRLYIIRNQPEEALDDDPIWWEKVGRFVEQCRGCGSYAAFYPRPFTAVVQSRQRTTECTSGRSGYLVLKRPFFDLLAPHMPGVVTGEVRFGDGRVQRDSVTLNFPPEMELTLRGGHGSRAKGAYRVCELCGERVASLAMLNKPIHVLRNEIPPGREVFNADGTFLTITERLSEELDFTPFPDIRLQPIGVFDTPVEPVPEFDDAAL